MQVYRVGLLLAASVLVPLELWPAREVFELLTELRRRNPDLSVGL